MFKYVNAGVGGENHGMCLGAVRVETCDTQAKHNAAPVKLKHILGMQRVVYDGRWVYCCLVRFNQLRGVRMIHKRTTGD